MDNIPSLVIKVSYGDMLRRFSTPLTLLGQLDLDMAGLKTKIISLFSLPLDAELNLTYVDEDGDVVALVDDNDLQDVMKQSLKFLKIDVQLKGKPIQTSQASSSGGSSQPAEDSLKNLDKSISNIMASFPEPLRGTVSGLFKDLSSSAVFTNPLLTEIFDSVSKLTQQASRPQESSPAAASVQEYTTLDPNRSYADALHAVPSDVDCNGAGGKSFGLGAASSSECPFSGVSINNDSRVPFHVPPRPCHFKKNHNSDFNSTMGMFHRGIRCDGCGVLPITGPRFKSKIKVDYDLCSICFSKRGDEKEYIRMDRPVQGRFGRPFKGIVGPGQKLHSLIQHGTPPPGGLQFRSKPKLDSRFILDVNVFDGTVIAPATSFTKIWRMRNNGSLDWPHGTQLVWIGGDRLSDSGSVDIEIPEGGVQVDEELNVAVDFRAPELPGRYISYWRMASSSGVRFGQRVWVLIHVHPFLKESVFSSFEGLDLNVPPPGTSRSQVFEDIRVSSHPDHPNISNFDAEIVKPFGDVIPKTVNSNILENDVAVVGSNSVFHSPSVPQNPSPALQQPNIDLANMVPGGTSGEASPVKDAGGTSEREKENDEVEQALLRELELMGFKEVDVNKEVLRKNEYNLEESVNALCGIDDWDPILDELQEMGFCDEETNKKLLKKNNGSIKRVVMDLLTSEKA